MSLKKAVSKPLKAFKKTVNKVFDTVERIIDSPLGIPAIAAAIAAPYFLGTSAAAAPAAAAAAEGLINLPAWGAGQLAASSVLPAGYMGMAAEALPAVASALPVGYMGMAGEAMQAALGLAYNPLVGAFTAASPVTSWGTIAASPLQGLAGPASVLTPTGPTLVTPTFTSAAVGGTSAYITELMRRLREIQANPFMRALNIGSGVMGLLQSQQLPKIAERVAAMQDPFGPERAQYAAQLRSLMADPSRITSYPGYQAGLDAVMRSMAAAGYLGSGNMMAALQQYGQQAFDQETRRLAQLAGANIPPTGGMALLEAQNLRSNLLSRALASIAMGLL